LAKKHIKTELKRSPTKRQLSKWQRQQRIQRIVTIAGAVFFALVLGYIGYGYYNEQFKPLHQPVVEINGTVFDMEYYTKLLELYSRGEEDSEVSSVADNLIEVIEYGEIIRTESPDVGYTVSTDEVKSELERLGLPDEKAYRDTVSSTMLAGKLLQNYFDPKVPSKCEQVQVQALFVESEETAKMVMDKLRGGEDFSSLATKYSLEPVTKEKGGDLGWISKDFTNMILGDLGNSLLKDIAFDLEPGMLSEPTYDGSATKEMGYWLVEVIEKDEVKGSHARGILLGSQLEAEEIRARIEAGEDFGALAKEYSQDAFSKGQGGDLGWTRQEKLTSEVPLALSQQLEPNILSQPSADASVKTKGGYWLVKVLDKDDSRTLDDETRGSIKLKLFGDWVDAKKQKYSVETYLTDEQKFRAIAQVLKKRGQ